MLLQEMTWPEIGNLSRDIPVLVPVAALEQHGHHMPVLEKVIAWDGKSWEMP